MSPNDEQARHTLNEATIDEEVSDDQRLVPPSTETTARGYPSTADGDLSDTTIELPVRAQTRHADRRGQEFGDYELLTEIARGGMGVVFKARQKRANRIVALKMILSGGLADEEEVRRFYTEAEAAANLDHPNIVPVYDVGQVNGQHYFSMGFVDGKSLSAEVRDGPLEPRRAAQLMQEVAEAIAYAHEHQIIHRDLKPANILLESDDRPRVTDFGLAKQIEGDSDLTASGQVMGTPSYMPPEQALGKIDQVGPLADVYSLGAVLYHLLTSRPPFRAASLTETLTQVVEQEPVSPRQLNPAIDLDLDTIVLKAMRKDLGKRYASAQHLVDDLTRHLEHRPILARPISTTERVIRWAKRNKAVAFLSGSLIIGMIAATIISWIVAVKMIGMVQNEKKNCVEKPTRRKTRQSVPKPKRAKTSISRK